MKNLLRLAAVLMFFGTTLPLGAAPSRETLKRPLPGLRRLPYLCFKPEGFDAQKKWPLIIFLHGSGERGWDLKGVTAHGLPKWLMAGNQVPALVLAPQCPPNRWWEPEDVDAMIDEAIEKYGVDEDRISLTGFSMGGYGSFDYAASSGWRLAAVAPVAGALERRHANGMKFTALWILCGSKDTAVLPQGSRDALNALKSTITERKFTEFPDADHTAAARIAYEETPELYDWMLKQRRSPQGLAQHEADSMGFVGDAGVLLAPGKSADFYFVVRNNGPKKKNYTFEWGQAGKRWVLSLSKKSASLASGEELSLKCSAALSAGDAAPAGFLPLPLLKITVDGKIIAEKELPAGLDNSGLILKAGSSGSEVSERFYPTNAWDAQGPKTELTASWNEKNLHLKVRALGQEGPAPKVLLHGHDQDIWTEDSVEFFLLPDLKKKHEYAQCAVNRAGAMYDAWVYDRSWESKAKASTKKIKDGWEVELLIPFSSLKMKPVAGSRLGFEVVRNAYMPGKRWSLQWAPTFAGSHEPERFGILELVEK